MWFPFDWLAKATPRMARLSLSVPQLVKMISSGLAPKTSATVLRASSSGLLGFTAETVYAGGIAVLFQ